MSRKGRTGVAPVRIERLELDGLPVYWAEMPERFSAGLVFRVGRADETLATGGLSHIVEHLALFAAGASSPAVNGSVGGTMTRLVVRASEEEEVVRFLDETATAVRDLPLDRLAAEKRVLLTEAQSGGGGIGSLLFSLRFGAAGYGLLGYEELGLRWLGEPEVARWARERFTQANAAVWIAGPTLPELQLELAPGRRAPPPEPVELEGLDAPCYVAAGLGVVAVSVVGRRSAALRAALGVAGKRLHQELRLEAGLTYAVEELYEPLTSETVFAAVIADCLEAHGPEVRDRLLGVLFELADDGPSAFELEEYSAETRLRTADPLAVASLAARSAADELRGARGASTLGFDECSDVSPEGAASALRSALETAVVILPEGLALPDAQFHAYELPQPEPVDGRTHRSLPIAPKRQGARLVVGDQGVSLLPREGERLTVRFDECAALLSWAGGTRTLVGSDGTAIAFNRLEFKGGGTIIDEIEARIPAERRVPMDDDVSSTVVEDVAGAKLDRPWAVAGELLSLPAELTGDEELITVAEARRRLKVGLLVVTDRRVLFLRSGADEELLELPRVALELVKGSHGLLGDRLVLAAAGKRFRFGEVAPRERVDEIVSLLRGADAREPVGR